MKTIICFGYENEMFYVTRKNTYANDICSKDIQKSFVFTNKVTLNNSIQHLIGGICLCVEKPSWEKEGRIFCGKTKLEANKISNLRTIEVDYEIKLTDKETIHEIKRKQAEIIINSEELKSRSFWNPFSK